MARITFSQSSSVVMRQLGNNQSVLASWQEKLSSGKALDRPSDDAIGVVNDLGLRTNLSHRNQNKRNDDSGSTYLTVLDSTLTGYDSLFQRTRELALEGASDTLQPSDRIALNNEAKQVLLQMVNMADTSYKGDYVFSGTDTNKVPYSVNTGTMNINTVANEIPAGGVVGDPTDVAFALNTPIQLFDRKLTDSTATASPYGNPQVKRIIPDTVSITGLTEGTDYTMDYVKGTITFLSANATAAATAGTLDVKYDWIRRNELANSNGDVNCEVEPGISMNINAKADDVFGKETDMDLFSSVISMMQGLFTSTQSQIESSVTNVDTSYNRLLGQQATIGARVNRMQSTSDRNDEDITTTTGLQSKVEDLDFADAISKYTLADTVYQASLKSASKILPESLMNYL